MHDLALSPPIRKVRIDVRAVDKMVLDVIRRHNPEQGKLTLEMIASQVDCHLNTAHAATVRLAAAGHLRKHGGRGRAGVTYEVNECLAPSNSPSSD